MAADPSANRGRKTVPLSLYNGVGLKATERGGETSLRNLGRTDILSTVAIQRM
jgi:hypothetical protein